MKVLRNKKKLAHNTEDTSSYMKYYVLFASLAVFFYIKYGSTFNIHGDELRNLIILSVSLGIVNLFTSLKRERNWVSLITGTCVPVLLFEVIILWRYSIIIRRVWLIGMVISCLIADSWAINNARKIKNTKLKRSVVSSRAFYLTRILCVVLSFVLCVYGKVIINTHQPVSMSDIEYLLSSTQEDIPDYENSLTANIQEVSKIDSDGGWNELSSEEKIKVLETIIRVECRYLGMRDSAPTFMVSYLEEGLFGQYDRETDTLTLSYTYMIDQNANGYSVVQVLCHEMYHRYQRYLVEMLEALKSSDETAKYADLLLMYDAGVYEENMDNYIVPSDGSEISYYLYFSQQLERDAEKYGNASVNEYYEAIQKYLQSN